MVLFYVTAHSGCAVLKTGRRRGTCTPASWDPDDKFSPLEILAAFRTSRCPAPEKYFFTGTPDYQNIDRLPNYFEPDTCCVGSNLDGRESRCNTIIVTLNLASKLPQKTKLPQYSLEFCLESASNLPQDITVCLSRNDKILDI